MADFAGGELLFHVPGQHGNMVIDRILGEVVGLHPPFDLQLRIVPGLFGFRFQDQHRGSIIGFFHQPRPLGDPAVPVSPGCDLDGLNVLGVFNPQRAHPQVFLVGEPLQCGHEWLDFRGMQESFEIAALIPVGFCKT